MATTTGGVLVAHQPAYLPWPGFFTRLLDLDHLVLLDHVQFTARSWQNRNHVADRRGVPTLLSVPVRRRHGQSLAETRIAGTGWAARHWRTLTHCYGKARYWPQWTEQLAGIYHASWEHLTDLNIALIRLLLDGLGHHVRIVRSCTMNLTGAKTTMLIELCDAARCRVLRVGTGALGYLDHAALHAAGIEVEVADYTPAGPLAARVAGSLLDTLLRHGPETRDLVLAGARTATWRPEEARA